MQDRTLTCCDCGEEFIFPVKDQEFYKEKGFSDPKRCPKCRAARKQQSGNRRNNRPDSRY
jgi:DNA replicative helicase MCM subunit Mcm2 (Cdc46/Mcm family)